MGKDIQIEIGWRCLLTSHQILTPLSSI